MKDIVKCAIEKFIKSFQDNPMNYMSEYDIQGELAAEIRRALDENMNTKKSWPDYVTFLKRT